MALEYFSDFDIVMAGSVKSHCRRISLKTFVMEYSITIPEGFSLGRKHLYNCPLLRR